MTYRDFLETAWHATALGADILAHARPGEIHKKGDRDLVTDADLGIQHKIISHLARATPDIGVLAEESDHQPNPDTAERLWVLDPIDGTSNFAHGLPLCAVSLALLENGQPVVAVTRAPLLQRTYHATKGGGAYLNGNPITASDTNQLTDAIVSLGDYATGQNAHERNQHRLALTAQLVAHVERIRMFGAATLDLVFVAEGATDAAIIMSNKPWDTAAGTLIAAEAGVSVTDAHGNPHTHQSTATIATTPGIASQLASIIKNSGTTS